MIGSKHWTVLQGWIPPLGDEAVSFLNTAAQDAHVLITVYYSDHDPVGPYRIIVPAGRMRRIRFNVLEDPEPLPRATDYASTIESDVPIVVQHPAVASQEHVPGLRRSNESGSTPQEFSKLHR
ncbi:MAG TPA: sensory rhodopsin transducer [Chthoniobacterales bacterium]|nr:sensory rhodopsin transducer [Chthoniobacterales bacterium]